MVDAWDASKGSIRSTHVDCGIVAHERVPLAIAARKILNVIPVALAAGAALVFPAAQWPFPRLLARRTSFHPLYLADPSDEALQWQREQVGENDGVVYCCVASVTSLPDSLQNLGFVLNPFGLQHRFEDASSYAPVLRERCRGGAVLVTLDWGGISYPEDLAVLPGIVEEVRFAEQSCLAAFGPETGWKLGEAQEISYRMQYPLEMIAARLCTEHAEHLREITRGRESAIVEIATSVIYRCYTL
jgi:hypothetical protein